tara:strand:+ start:155 stop:580 length:426 start_codon:yes stop_codon:yes gene_type:complete
MINHLWPFGAYMSKDDKFDSAKKTIGDTTIVVKTPESDSRFGDEDTYWVYSKGMRDGHGMEDLEMRGVSSIFVNSALRAINEMNAYRIAQEKPFKVGQTVEWGCGTMKITHGDDWDGQYTWKGKDIFRLNPMHVPIKCDCC